MNGKKIRLLSYLFLILLPKLLNTFKKRKITKNATIAVITTNKKFNRSLKLKPTPSKKFLTLILTLKNPHKIKLPTIPTEAAVSPTFDFLIIHTKPMKEKVIIIKINLLI